MGRQGLMDDSGYHGFEECSSREECCSDAYRQGRADAIEDAIHRLDNARVNCHEDYEDGISFSIGVLKNIAEKLKENKNEDI